MFRTLTFALFLASTAIVAEAQQPNPKATPPRTKRMDPRELVEGIALGHRPFRLLLMNPLVAAEIRPTEEQKVKLKEVERKSDELTRAFSKNKRTEIDQYLLTERQIKAGNPSVEQLNRLNLENAKGIVRLQDESDLAIAREVLDPPQALRLGEIQAQAEGPGYFERPEVQKHLALDEDQVEQIKQIMWVFKKQSNEVSIIPWELAKPRPGADPTPEVRAYEEAVAIARTNVAKVRESTMITLEKVLSTDQWDKYKKMVGKPFRFDQTKEEAQEKK
jgi:hypothetical protein